MAQLGVIVVAAGSGTRLGAPVPKAFVELAGTTLLQRALEPISALGEPTQIVVVAPADRVHAVRASAPPGVSVVAGGASRQKSVAAGLREFGAEIEIVLVHDAARPLTPTSVFERVIALVRSSGDGVIPGLPVADTLKATEGGIALATVDRSLLSAVGTPQGFPRAQLDAAYAAADSDHTDDAALFSAAGHVVRVIEGDPRGFKITTSDDLDRAEMLLRPPLFRTGIGIDVHAYDATQSLWLGGIHWPGETGLAGHSDGDAVSHAICDALLSAAGLGDIGTRFGTDDPRFENAHGDVFLRATVDLVTAAGFRIQNVAVQVIGQTPRMSPRRLEVEERLAELVGAPVSVSATTTDGLGFTGRGEGLMAMATALLLA